MPEVENRDKRDKAMDPEIRNQRACILMALALCHLKNTFKSHYINLTQFPLNIRY